MIGTSYTFFNCTIVPFRLGFMVFSWNGMNCNVKFILDAVDAIKHHGGQK